MKLKKKIPVFSILLTTVILALSILATQISSRIYVSTNSQKIMLVNTFADQLADNAIYRARSLDPEANWLILQDDPPQAVRSYIETNLSSLIHLNGDQMSKDSNLAWIITYKGKQYQHNWKDAYDQDPAALDYTIRSDNGKITYQGTNVPSNTFSRELSLQVNPSIVPEDRLTTQGTEYTYSLTLPSDFSIRYYIPAEIKSNGGLIASAAADLDHRNITFSILGGSAVILLLILVVRWRIEKDAWMLSHFRKLQALFAWLTLLLIGWGCGAAVVTVCQANASGTLALMFKSFGMSTQQAATMSFGCALLLWAALFEVISLGCLYMKSIISEGFVRYLSEDTLISELIRKGQEEVSEALQSDKGSRSGLHLALITLIFCSIIALIMAIAARMSMIWLLIAFVVVLIVSFLFIMGVYHSMTRSYTQVEEAASQLAQGNFNDLEEKQIGYYQTLYDLMVDVAKSSREAVKEGLASQISKTQLISNVSHDLKTPVAGIQSYSELITMTDNMDDIHEYAKRLSNYAMRLNDLITDLFDIAKATSGDIKLEPIDLDLSELVMQVAAEWDDQFQQKNLRMVFDLQKEAILHLDPGKTVRVIENLLSNIYKYSLPNTRVFIELHAQDGLYQLVLKNTSSTEMNFNPDQIVERFVRGDASRHEKGSGLGLAIVKSFVEIQQGTFEVKTDGDLFKACISFAIPPVPVVPIAEEEKPKPVPISSDLDGSAPVSKHVLDHPDKKEQAQSSIPSSIDSLSDQPSSRQTSQKETTAVISGGLAAGESKPVSSKPKASVEENSGSVLSGQSAKTETVVPETVLSDSAGQSFVRPEVSSVQESKAEIEEPGTVNPIPSSFVDPILQAATASMQASRAASPDRSSMAEVKNSTAPTASLEDLPGSVDFTDSSSSSSLSVSTQDEPQKQGGSKESTGASDPGSLPSSAQTKPEIPVQSVLIQSTPTPPTTAMDEKTELIIDETPALPAEALMESDLDEELEEEPLTTSFALPQNQSKNEPKAPGRTNEEAAPEAVDSQAPAPSKPVDDPLMAIELETDPIKKASMISALSAYKDLSENSQKIVAQKISQAISEVNEAHQNNGTENRTDSQDVNQEITDHPDAHKEDESANKTGHQNTNN